MTSNHLTRLDDALVRPGRVDQKVELGLTDKKMTADLFCVVFKPVEGDVHLSKNAQCARSQEAEVKRVERLANEFAARVPELNYI